MDSLHQAYLDASGGEDPRPIGPITIYDGQADGWIEFTERERIAAWMCRRLGRTIAESLRPTMKRWWQRRG